MNGILNLVAIFSVVFRHIGNFIRKSSVNRTIKKLQNSKEYRMEIADEMSFLVGKVIDPDYDTVYRTIKENITVIQTKKFEVKGVFDVNIDSFLIFVLCNDFDVELGRNGNTNLSKFIRLYCFKVQRFIKESKVEMRTHMFDDLNEKNLLIDFYLQTEKLY
jgi:hypothetical protein